MSTERPFSLIIAAATDSRVIGTEIPINGVEVCLANLQQGLSLIPETETRYFSMAAEGQAAGIETLHDTSSPVSVHRFDVPRLSVPGYGQNKDVAHLELGYMQLHHRLQFAEHVSALLALTKETKTKSRLVAQVHTPGPIGATMLDIARRQGIPRVATHHTDFGQYAEGTVLRLLEGLIRQDLSIDAIVGSSESDGLLWDIFPVASDTFRAKLRDIVADAVQCVAHLTAPVRWYDKLYLGIGYVLFPGVRSQINANRALGNTLLGSLSLTRHAAGLDDGPPESFDPLQSASSFLARRAKEMTDFYLSWFYSHCTLVIARSETQRKELERLQVPADRIRVLPPESDPEHFTCRSPRREKSRRDVAAYWREKFGVQIEEGANVCVSVGRVSFAEKDCDFLAAFWKEFYEQSVSPKPHLMLVGSANDREEFEAVVGTDANVHFLGQVEHWEDLPLLLEHCDLALQPSTTETLGQVAIEAGLMELPVFVSNAGAMQQFIDDGVTGRVLPVTRLSAGDDRAEEVAAWVEAANAVFSDRDQALSMGSAAREKIVSLCSKERMAQAFRDIHAEAAVLHLEGQIDRPLNVESIVNADWPEVPEGCRAFRPFIVISDVHAGDGDVDEQAHALRAIYTYAREIGIHGAPIDDIIWNGDIAELSASPEDFATALAAINAVRQEMGVLSREVSLHGNHDEGQDLATVLPGATVKESLVHFDPSLGAVFTHGHILGMKEFHESISSRSSPSAIVEKVRPKGVERSLNVASVIHDVCTLVWRSCDGFINVREIWKHHLQPTVSATAQWFKDTGDACKTSDGGLRRFIRSIISPVDDEQSAASLALAMHTEESPCWIECHGHSHIANIQVVSVEDETTGKVRSRIVANSGKFHGEPLTCIIACFPRVIIARWSSTEQRWTVWKSHTLKGEELEEYKKG